MEQSITPETPPQCPLCGSYEYNGAECGACGLDHQIYHEIAGYEVSEEKVETSKLERQ